MIMMGTNPTNGTGAVEIVTLLPSVHTMWSTSVGRHISTVTGEKRCDKWALKSNHIHHVKSFYLLFDSSYSILLLLTFFLILYTYQLWAVGLRMNLNKEVVFSPHQARSQCSFPVQTDRRRSRDCLSSPCD